MAVRFLSTRARAQLWKLQEAVRSASRERDRLLRVMDSSRTSLLEEARREIWMEFSLADQEYRHAVACLADFVAQHGGAAGAGNAADSGRDA
jgi:hypothetical protein